MQLIDWEKIKLIGEKKLFIMSYVGLAFATGQVVDIPIILRSLTVSLANVPSADLPIPFDLGFLEMLQVGTNDEELGRVVRSYALPWWRRSKPPADGETLNAETLEQCLIHHRDELLISVDGRPISPIPINTVSSLQIRPVAVPDGPLHGGGASAPGGPSRRGDGVSVVDGPACPECEFHRTLSADLIEELRGIRTLVSGVGVSSTNEAEVAARSAAGLYHLHEQVSLKEMSSDSSHVGGTGAGTRAQRLGRQVSHCCSKPEEARSSFSQVDLG